MQWSELNGYQCELSLFPITMCECDMQCYRVTWLKCFVQLLLMHTV